MISRRAIALFVILFAALAPARASAVKALNAVDGAQVDGIDGQAVEGIGGQRGDMAGGERADHQSDQLWLGLIRVNAEYLGRQRILLCEGLELGCNGEQRKNIA